MHQYMHSLNMKKTFIIYKIFFFFSILLPANVLNLCLPIKHIDKHDTVEISNQNSDFT